jgi:PAS domain S-box-containing protein
MDERSNEKKSMSNFQDILNLISDPVVVVDESQCLICTNQALEGIINKNKLDLIGKSLQQIDLFDEQTKKHITEMFTKRLKGEQIDPYEVPIKVDDKTYYFEIMGKKIEYLGSPADLIGLHDITKRRTAQEKNRQQMELKVSEAEKLYQALFDQTPLGVAVIDPQTTAIIKFNDSACRQLGYTREEYAKLHLSDFEVSESPQQIQNRIKNTLQEGHIEFISKHRAKNGEVKNILANSLVIEVSGKKVLLCSYHDVTRISKMRKALRSSEQKSQAIANAISDALIMVDENSEIIYWNPAAEKIFGYKLEEAIGKKIHELILPETLSEAEKETIDRNSKSLFTTGKSCLEKERTEGKAKRKDGSEFPAEMSISPIMIAGKWHAVGSIKNISVRKRNELKLKEAEQRYRALFNQAPLGVLVIDPETAEYIEFNDVAHCQLGYSREEFAKLKVFDVQVKESPEQVREHLKKLAFEKHGEFETLHRTKQGEIKKVIVTIKAFESADKTFLHCIWHDITEIKTAKEALLNSEARFRQLVEVAQEGIWAIDKDAITTFVNPRMATMLGYSEGEIIGRKLFEFIDEDMVKVVKLNLDRFNQKIGKEQFEYAFPRKDGSHVETSLALSNILNSDGQSIGTLALISDITERKQVERALKKSEELSRAIVANAPIGIATSDSSYHFLSANEAFCRIVGYTEEELRKLTFRAFTIPDDLEDSLLKMRALEKGEIQSFILEKHYLKKDGSTIFGRVMINAIRNQEGTPIVFIVELEDITEAKQMEDELRQERDMLESVTTNIGAGVSIIDKNYRILYANEELKKLGQVENKLCYNAYAAANTVCPDCGVKKVIETGVDIDRHDYYNVVAGEGRWIELIVTPIKDKEGKIIAALELAVNITERKRLQSELSAYSQKLEELVQKRTDELKKAQADLVKNERLAAIGELAGMVGHDLRNPLTGIKNSAYFLKRKGKDISPVQYIEMLETIDRCVDYSNKIIADLVDYSREIKLLSQKESPKKLVEESLRILKLPENIRIQNNLSEEPTVMVDVDRIKRVFINLLKNAIEAMPNGGKITVEGKEKQGILCISFSDTGVGINEEVLPKLFSPLFTTKAQGMGFGLAICKRIIEAHAGTITVQSSKGRGTVFSVSLPISDNMNAEVKEIG